ncbi:MAG: hypothetical protein ACTSVC_03100 [Promethearchaeota archaeon]
MEEKEGTKMGTDEKKRNRGEELKREQKRNSNSKKGEAKLSVDEFFKEIDIKKYPVTTSTVHTDVYSLIVLLEFSVGVWLLLLINLWYIDVIFKEHFYWLLLLFPLSLYGDIWFFVFSIAVFAMVLRQILVIFHKPKEGIFPINGKEFKWYKLRYWTIYFPIWLGRALPLPWVDFIIAKLLGSKIGRNVCLYDSWMDVELIDVGHHVMTSLNTSILSHSIVGDKFIQLRVVLERDSITGAQSVVAPGTHLEPGAILGANCTTYYTQRLKRDLIHVGTPASMTFPIKASPTYVIKSKEDDILLKQKLKRARENKRPNNKENKEDNKENKEDNKEIKEDKENNSKAKEEES